MKRITETTTRSTYFCSRLMRKYHPASLHDQDLLRYACTHLVGVTSNFDLIGSCTTVGDTTLGAVYDYCEARNCEVAVPDVQPVLPHCKRDAKNLPRWYPNRTGPLPDLPIAAIAIPFNCRRASQQHEAAVVPCNKTRSVHHCSWRRKKSDTDYAGCTNLVFREEFYAEFWKFW